MKIIGTTQQGFLLDASTLEIAHIMGYYRDTNPEVVMKLRVGLEIQVGKIYNTFKEISGQRSKHIDLAKQLRNYADLISALPDPLNEMQNLIEG